MSIQSVFTMIKPGFEKKRIVGNIIQRFEQKGLILKSLKACIPTQKQLESLYREHKNKPFYSSLIEYMSAPIIAMVWQGEEAVSMVRTLIGATNPLEAKPGTIRGDFALFVQENVIHASDSEKSAEREIKIFFKLTDLI